MARISISDRVDAVVATMRIYEYLKDDSRWPRDVPDHQPWRIIAELQVSSIDRVVIRRCLDEVLEARLEPHHLMAHVRARVCEVENACGLLHDDRSVEAFLAQGNRDTWRALTDRLKTEARPIEVPIPSGAGATP
jgi:hypothetical protein